MLLGVWIQTEKKSLKVCSSWGIFPRGSSSQLTSRTVQEHLIIPASCVFVLFVLYHREVSVSSCVGVGSLGNRTVYNTALIRSQAWVVRRYNYFLLPITATLTVALFARILQDSGGACTFHLRVNMTSCKLFIFLSVKERKKERLMSEWCSTTVMYL